jgi:RHS repeat-associated protein
LNKETNPATGFSYHGARWIAPQTARWTAPDPPLKAPNSDHIGDPWDLNPYQYVRQNPTLYADPDGEIFFVFIAVLVVYTLAVTHESTANAPRTPDETTYRSPTNLEVAIGVVQNAPDVARFTLPKWAVAGSAGNRLGGGAPPPKSTGSRPSPGNIRPGPPPRGPSGGPSGKPPAPSAGDTRRGAFQKAKRDLDIPRNQQPNGVKRVPMTDKSGKSILGPDGKPIMTREYTYTRSDGSKVVVQEHSAGHKFGEGGVGDQGPHFNIRPIENTRTGTVPGTQEHYPFSQ